MSKDFILAAALADKDISNFTKRHILELPIQSFKSGLARNIFKSFKESKDVLDLDKESLEKIAEIHNSSEYKVFLGSDKDLQLNTISTVLNEYKQIMISKYVDEFNLKTLEDIGSLDVLSNKLFKQIASLPSLDGATSSEDAAAKVVNIAREAMEAGEKPLFQTQYPKFNKAISGGFRRGDVAVLLGDTGRGKTTFVQNLIRDFNYQGYKILYVTTEMQDHELVKKFMKMEVYHNKIKGFSEDIFDLPNNEQLNTLISLQSIVSKYNIDFVYADEVGKIAFEMNRKPYDIVIIDHMHDIKGVNDNSSTTVDDLLSTLKNWAIQNDGLCIALTQPRKGSVNQDTDEERRLRVDDIKGSKAIQTKASQILILHRGKTSVFTEVEIDKDRWSGKSGQIINFGYDPLLVYVEK